MRIDREWRNYLSSDLAAAGIRAQIEQHTRSCGVCGTTFHVGMGRAVSARTNKLYCSAACNTAAWRKRKAEATIGR